jgi:glycosyltransferase involved in cell wall biosynthesis
MNDPCQTTAVILTLNECDNLERCVGSLRWCAEVIVVDSGSSDGTQERARELGCRVLTNIQEPSFRIDVQRNWALDNAAISTPWVLFLDADEAVPSELAAVLREKCIDPDCAFDAFELTPRYLFWGKWLKRTQGYPNWHPRLVRIGATRFSGGVWEHFAPGARIGRITTPYDHFANSKGLSDWLKRHDRYSSWDAACISAFLDTGDAASLGTTRKSQLRVAAARWWLFRPWVRFLQMYVLRLGFLEGRAAFVFCTLYFYYEWMTVVKIVELRRRRLKQPL